MAGRLIPRGRGARLQQGSRVKGEKCREGRKDGERLSERNDPLLAPAVYTVPWGILLSFGNDLNNISGK